jgi:hypothetical protein
MKKTEVRSYFKTVGSFLNLYGIDVSVQSLEDPKNAERIIVESNEINDTIGQHF